MFANTHKTITVITAVRKEKFDNFHKNSNKTIGMTNKRILWTLFLSQALGWIGIASVNYLKSPFLFAFLVGVSIPIANWQWLKFNKGLSVLALGVLSVLLFSSVVSLTILMGQLSQNLPVLWTGLGQSIPYLCIGLASMVFMYLHTLFISNFRMRWNLALLTVTLNTGLFPVMTKVFEQFNRTEPNITFMLWVFITTVLICLSAKKNNFEFLDI